MTDLPSIDEHLCYSIYSTSLAINRIYKPMLDDMGITYPQYLVLLALWEEDGRSISAIAGRLGLESSTITPLVKRLEHAGFLTRRRSGVDERLVEVFLSDRSAELKLKVGCLTDKLLQRSKMSLDDLLALNGIVKKLRAVLVDS